MSIATATLDSDAVGADEAITVPGTVGEQSPRFKRVTVREQAGAATTGFTIRAPYRDSAIERYQAGEIAVLEATDWFMPGETIAYIACLTTSTTFSLRWDRG